MSIEFNAGLQEFQSTYLYKVRRSILYEKGQSQGFNPRTYIRYDKPLDDSKGWERGFNPRTYIRYDSFIY